MADKKYIVLTPLKRPGASKGEFETIPPNKTVTLPEEEGDPLVLLGALREPDVIDEAQPAKPAGKK